MTATGLLDEFTPRLATELKVPGRARWAHLRETGSEP
jgi:hypothetical protein